MIALLRVIWSIVKHPRWLAEEAWDYVKRSLYFQWRHDRMRRCPHDPEWHQSHTEGWIDCAECGMCIKNPKGWRI